MTSVVIFIGKVSVCLASTGTAILILMYYDPQSSLLLPGAIMLLLTYYLAYAFMTVYETAVDTVFVCFLLDEEWNKENPTAEMFADKGLLEIVEKYAEQSKTLAAEEKGLTVTV